jgi:hypothetical protein
MDYKTYLATALLVLVLIGAVNAAIASTATAPTNVVVDFDSTAFDSSLSPGDSGILNLVIENTGGYRADDIEIYIPSTGTVNADKRFEIGRLDPEESKTLPFVVRVNKDAKTGLTAVNVRVNYDGFKSDGTALNNQLTTWDVPLMVYGKPAFQLTPEKTTFYKDTMDELVFEGKLLASVKYLEASLSSECLTVIGSSRQYLGDIPANEGFKLSYQVKPTVEAACMAYVGLTYTDESGTSASSNISVGLNVEGAGVDFKVLNVSYEPTGPGETVKLDVVLKNVGKADARDVTLGLSLSEPFVPVDTSERYVEEVAAGETLQTVFSVNVGYDAEIQPYTIPMVLTYKVGGTTYTVDKSIGVDVTGKVILEIINVDQSRGNLQVEVANIGSRTAEGVKAILKPLESGNRTRQVQEESGAQQPTTDRQRASGNPLTMLTGGGRRPGGFSSGQRTQTGGAVPQAAAGDQLIEYKSDIKPTKQTTFTFETTVSGSAMLTLEYTGLNNQRVTQVERLNFGGATGARSASATGTARSRDGTSTTTKAIYAVVLAAAAFVGYKLYKRRKNRK